MARFLLRLSERDFAKYKETNLHVVPRGAWARLSEEEQAQARAKGILAKADDYQTHSGAPVDEMPIADPYDGTAAALEPADATPGPDATATPIASLCADERTWYVVRQVLDHIIASPNARLEAECFRISSGLGMLDDITEASVARKHGLTRAAVSKRCVRLTKLVGMKPSQYMRSLKLRETYQKARIRSIKSRSNVQ